MVDFIPAMGCFDRRNFGFLGFSFFLEIFICLGLTILIFSLNFKIGLWKVCTIRFLKKRVKQCSYFFHSRPNCCFSFDRTHIYFPSSQSCLPSLAIIAVVRLTDRERKAFPLLLKKLQRTQQEREYRKNKNSQIESP